MNFKSFIVLSLTLAAGLVGGWFLGFGVTNEELDVDWKSITPSIAALIASSIASGTALCISNKWGKQKRAEIIVDEVEHLLSNIFEVREIISYLGYVNVESDASDVINKILELKKLLDKISKRNKFFQVALNGEEKIKAIIAFENHIFSFYNIALKNYIAVNEEQNELNANYEIVCYFEQNKEHIGDLLSGLSESAFKEIYILLSYKF